MPVVRSVIPYRKSRRLRQTDPKQYHEDDDLWETYDETLLAPALAPAPMKSEPDDEVIVVVAPSEAAHIPRPRNAFICFRSEYVKAEKRVSARPGSLDQTVMSRGAADVWRGLSDAERAPYIRMAQEEKSAHTLKYPNYRYAPGNASGVARKSKKAKASAAALVQDPARTYTTNPPAARPVARRKSPARPSRPRRKSTAVPPVPVPVPEPVEPIAEALVYSPARSPSPAPPPAVETPEPDCKEEIQPEIVPSTRPISVECHGTLPFGFKDGLAPGAISLQFAPRTRSPSPASPADLDLQTLSLDSLDAIDEPAAPAPWDSWAFAPLELLDDTEPLSFDTPSADFGFFYPRTLNCPSLARELRSTFSDDVFAS